MKIVEEKNVVLNEVVSELNFRERIIVKVFKKTFIKVCNIQRIIIVNNILR